MCLWIEQSVARGVPRRSIQQEVRSDELYYWYVYTCKSCALFSVVVVVVVVVLLFALLLVLLLLF